MPSTPLPAAAEGLPTVQALPRITRIEPRFVIHEVKDSRGAPLLADGDYAVIDTSDTMPVAGGRFLVEWSTGRRDLMETRPQRCELVTRNGAESLVMRRDGAHTVWHFDTIVCPRSTEEIQEWIRCGRPIGLSDGPYELEHLRSKIVGRLIGIVDGEAATRWAQRQAAACMAEVDRRAKEASANFDAEACIDLRDRTGQVMVVLERPEGEALFSALISCPTSDATRVYKEHADVFQAEKDGGHYSRQKLSAELRRAGRVMRQVGKKWVPDPQMPAHVYRAHVTREAAR